MNEAPANKRHLHLVPDNVSSQANNTTIDQVLIAAERPVIELVREFHDRSALVIPTHENPERLESIQQVLSGIGQQPRHNVDTYIADNGISFETRSAIEECARRFGVALKGIIDARPTSVQEKSPAFARNKAVSHIFERGQDKPGDRVDSFIFGDDDAVFSQNALRILIETHQSASDIAAVMPEIVPVKSLHQYLVQTDERPANGNNIRVMPNLWTEEGQIELMKIIGFASDVTTKSCGLLIDAEAIQRIRNQGQNDLFVKMPRKSGEDMLVGTALSRLGRIVRNDNAKIYDKVRSSRMDTRKQRAAWGEDHVYIAHDFNKLGYTQCGLTLLQANTTNGEWVEFNIQNYENTVFVINPEQIARVLKYVKFLYQQEGSQTFFTNFGVSVDKEKFERAIQALEKLLSEIRGDKIARKTLVKRKYNDIPPMDLNPGNNPRFSDDALAGLLVGNLVGNAKLNPDEPIFYGLRQALAIADQ